MRLRRRATALGFSLVELVTIIVVAGIIVAVAVPQLSGTKQTYDDLGFYDATKAILRYAQKSAVAKRRTVCVAFTATSISVTFATAPLAAVCNANLIGPAGENPYTVNAVSSTFAPVPNNFTFNSLGQASAGQVISIVNATNITVNADTGYVQ